MKGETRRLLALAGLFFALAFDPAGLFRCTLLAAAVHECGHGLAFWFFTGKPPRLQADGIGFALQAAGLRLSKRREAALLLAGPGANFLAAAFWALRLGHKGSVQGWFSLAAHLLLGGFNLLPVGVLDGARLLRLLLGPDSGLFDLVQAAALAIGTLFIGSGLYTGALRPAAGLGLAACLAVCVLSGKDQL